MQRPSHEKKTCIYCLEPKANDQFNREHVIPEAFGKFDSQSQKNLVLDCVCTDCNTEFSKTIELKFGRDSIEGIDRYSSGMKPTSEFKSLGRKSTTVVEFKEGPNAGLRGHLCANPTNAPELRAKSFPYIGFAQERVEEGRIRWFTLDAVPPKSELEQYGFVRGQVLLVHTREMAWEDARNLLTSKGYAPLPDDPETTMPPEGETFEMTTIVTIGRLEQRAVAKIALNYLAAVAGSGFARAPQFREVRNFVRHDIGTPPVWPTENLVRFKFGDRPVTKGHYLAVQTTPEGNVLADVCIMLRLRYTVLLTDAPFTLSIPHIRYAHLFDLDAHEVRRAAPPPAIYGRPLMPTRRAAGGKGGEPEHEPPSRSVEG